MLLLLLSSRDEQGSPLSFFHVQNISVCVTRTFVDHVRHQPLVFEVFGHFQQTLSRCDSGRSGPACLLQTRQPPKRMLPPLLPVSQPLRPTKFGSLPPSPTSQVRRPAVLHVSRFYHALPSFTGFLVNLTRIYWVLFGFSLSFTCFHWILLSISRFYHFLSGFTGF